VPKILVADDNANIQKMVVLAFEERGIQVVTAANGEAAVRRIPDLNPDLILADIFMPVRNGYEVCEFVKKDPRFSHIPVILLVGAFDPLDEKEARRVGADGVLKKPFVPPDPLIAMVMSALEKNPNVVAELAKAKEAKEVLPPEPVSQLVIPARPEPKPLPEFPEPTSPEEAALVYGFGRGVRAQHNQPLSGQDAKGPLAEAEEEGTGEAEFDGASTSRDWRRDAMDFEIPTESANKPAFSSVEDFEPVTFPSESDHPARRVRIAEPEPQIEAVGNDSVAAPVANDEAAAFMEAAAKVDASLSAPLEASFEPAGAAELSGGVTTAIEKASASQPQPISEAAPILQNEPESEPLAEPGSSSSVPHWMDALGPLSSQPARGGWMETLAGQVSATEAVSGRADEPREILAPSASTIESVEAHAEASAEAIVEERQPPAASSASIQDEAPAVQEPEVHEPAVHEPAAHAPEESWFAPAPPVFERIYDTVSVPVAVATSEPDRALELDQAAHEPALAFKDPGLVEPTAVRVTPEPLLVNDDEPRGPSEYGAQAQATSPLHAFCAPPPEPVAEETAARDGVPSPSLESLPESPSSELNERIPTAPPPNLEALSEIPFLTPPPDFRAEIREAATNSDAVDVDEVVRKVLEKLQPQLQDLLAQGLLKPLVESLLQSELVKKGK